MKIEYELAKKDLAEFQKHHIAHAGRGGRNFQYVMILIVAAIVVVINKDMIFSGPINDVIMQMMIVVIVLGGLFYIIRKSMRNPNRNQIEYLVRRNPYLMSRQCVEITDAGLIIQNTSQDRRIGWDGIDRIEENDGYIFIYFNARSAHIIPKRAFSDKVQAEAFLAFLKSKTERGAAI